VAARRTSEFERIDRIQQLLDAAPRRQRTNQLEVGIGDDAAVLRLDQRSVWTVDAQVEGVHFDRRWLSLGDIGYRSFQAAVSDVAAMGARPVAALSSLALPASLKPRELEALVRGQAEAANECRCPIIGGNLSKASELSITTTVLGRVKRPLLRSGARPGDELWLVGRVGMARAGLLALMRALRSRKLKPCIVAWRRPRALCSEGQALVGRARAAIDVSDGLAGDAQHLAKASQVRLVFEAARLEASFSPEFALAAAELGVLPIELALSGGEDYALLCSGPSARRPRFARAVGHVERGRGVWLERDGRRKELSGSFDHFSSS
jgi:thiamine-monophosphate kinase